MGKTLVVMAAGLGSRYGGVKQMERLGPGGEILMEYAIYDAVHCGFDQLVIIIKPDMHGEVMQLFGDRVERGTGLQLCFAMQSMDGYWNTVAIPPRRTKPLGTVHALLSAREYLNQPFAVINADDFYGRGAIAAVGSVLDSLHSGSEGAMVAYRLKNTVSPFGTVTRGICREDRGHLLQVDETFHIRLAPDGSIRDSSDGDGRLLEPESPVSMNLWGFHPGVLEMFDDYFTGFLRELDPEDNHSECLLPVAVDALIRSEKLQVEVLETDEHWFGLTYPEDKAGVVAELQALHGAGVYPPTLWRQ